MDARERWHVKAIRKLMERIVIVFVIVAFGLHFGIVGFIVPAYFLHFRLGHVDVFIPLRALLFWYEILSRVSLHRAICADAESALIATLARVAGEVWNEFLSPMSIFIRAYKL